MEIVLSSRLERCISQDTAFTLRHLRPSRRACDHFAAFLCITQQFHVIRAFITGSVAVRFVYSSVILTLSITSLKISSIFKMIDKIIPRLWSFLFILMCAAGLLWQLITIIDLYFQFKVTTTTNVFTPEVLNPLAMTFCVKIHEVIDHQRLKQDFGRNYSNNAILHNLTIQNLFDYTPSNDGIVLQFSYKTSKFSRHKDVLANISNHLDITKFFQRWYVCYKIKLRGDEQLNYREISVTSNDQFLVKSFTFNQSLSNAEFVKVMLGHVNQLPYRGMISTIYKWGTYIISFCIASCVLNF